LNTWSGRRGGEPEVLGNVLARQMRVSGMREKLRHPEIYDCWPEVAGAEACKHTRVVGYNNAVLYVEVDSAPWLHMLSTFKKPELLRGLEQTAGGVRVKDIRFRIGSPGPS
jgi:predicted nucleic acid-binding Zn ribbon protein